MRRGLKKELSAVFEEAIGMLGGGDPNAIEPETARYTALKKEVFSLLTRGEAFERERVFLREPRRTGVVTADDHVLAEQLYIAVHHPDTGLAIGQIAHVISNMRERAVFPAAKPKRS